AACAFRKSQGAGAYGARRVPARPARRRVRACGRDRLRTPAAPATPSVMDARRDWRKPLGLATLASALGALLVYAGPPGTDFAEHVYQVRFYAAHGFLLWNNLWYSGRYSFVTYSVLYYPLAALVGIRALAVASAAVGVLAFDVVAVRRWGQAG